MSIRFLNKGGSSVAIKPNIFMQETEPEIKEGIWLQANKEMGNVVIVDNVVQGYYWDTKNYSNIPYDFYLGSAVAIGTNIYLFGGYPSDSRKLAYKYDTLTDTYTKLTDIPYSFYNGSVVAIGTDIYLLGGQGSVKNKYKYDTLTDTYTQLANLATDTYTHPAIAIGTDIYTFGGYNTTTGTYKYETSTDTYVKLTDVPYWNASSCVANIGNYIYIFGSNTGGKEKLAYKYDILENTYTQLSELPYSMSYAGAIAMNEKEIYLFGGGTTDTTKTSLYKYDIETDTYTQLENIPKAFFQGSIVQTNKGIYLLGGATYTNTVQLYANNIIEFEDKAVVINQGNTYSTQILSAPENVQGRLTNSFNDAWYNTTENGLDDTISTYYGDGTEWIKFKN